MSKIELLKWKLEDRETLALIANSVNRNFLSDRLPSPYTLEAADWWLNMVREHDGTDGLFRAISINGKIIGNISVEPKNDVYRKDAEIGYFLLEEYSSQGIMTDAVRQICELAFQELDIVRITGLVYEPNAASRKVLEKNGFVLEGIMKQAVYKNSNLYDLCVYGKYQ